MQRRRDHTHSTPKRDRRDATPLLENQESESEPVRVISYVFTGKLTLFPVVILFLGFGAGYLLFYGNKTYTAGYFESTELYYGIAGLAVSVVALTLFFFLVTWMVLRISFVVTPTSFRLEFALDKTSLHYFRTHYHEDRAWLQLIVKEDGQYYQIFSWKGAGKQRERFLELFRTLKYEVRLAQGSRPRAMEAATVIVSREEFTVIGPFAARYKRLVGKMDDDLDRAQAQPLCIEDIPVVSYDSFFHHFTRKKQLLEADLRLL